MRRARASTVPPSSDRAQEWRDKRLRVRGRLTEPDAWTLSDRALARELGVSQPFVSAQRRLVAPWRARMRAATAAERVAAPASPATSTAVLRPRPVERVLGVEDGDLNPLGGPVGGELQATAETDVSRRATSAQEALDRFHDERSPLGRVRRVCRPVTDDDTSRARTEFDPFRW